VWRIFIGMEEPGLDRHEWETEWEALEPLVEESPAEALPELDRLVERMLEARGFAPNDPVAAEGADPEVAAEFAEAHRIARLIDAGEAPDPADVAVAVEGFRNLFDQLIGEHHER
jgi:hypothetical protein